VPLAAGAAKSVALPVPPDGAEAAPARGDGKLLLSPGGQRLLAIGDRDEGARSLVRAFDGKAWRVLGPVGLTVDPPSPAIALSGEGFAVALGGGEGRPRVVFVNGRAARSEAVPVGKNCTIKALARDGDDLLAAGHCGERGLLVRRHDGRWFDEGVKAPPLYALAAGPGGVVAAGDRGAVVLREARGWVLGSTGEQSWRQAAAGRDATYLVASGDVRVHLLRGRGLDVLPALPPAAEPPMERRPAAGAPAAAGAEALRRIVAISGGGGALGVLAEVPQGSDHRRRRTYGLFAWDGRDWTDLGRSTQVEQGDAVTRAAARQVVASDEAIWCDDDGVPTLLWPAAAGGKPLGPPPPVER
jgi:hypothetical protein